MDILIVEDEKLAVDNLACILSDMEPAVTVAGAVGSVTDCVAWLGSHPAPDLIFMDVQLADGSAFEIFNRAEVTSSVVFATAYSEYAIRAFKVNALDYIVKPVDPDEVRAAVRRCAERLDRGPERASGRLRGRERACPYSGRLWIGYRDRLIPVDVSDISFVFTNNKETDVHLVGGRKFRLHRSLDSIGNMLDPALFYRANKQFIVAKRRISGIIVWPDNRLIVEMTEPTPERIFVSKNRSAEFRRWITSVEEDLPVL